MSAVTDKLRYFPRERVFLLGMLALGALLRVISLDDQSLTMDEVEDVQVAWQDADLEQIFRGARRFPPLYHMILRLWSSVIPGDLGARYLSVVIGLATILAMWQLGKQLAGPRAGAAAAYLAAISPFFVWYSQETRVYGLFLLLATLTTTYFFRASETERPADWTKFVLAGVGGMYTHYYFAFLLVSLALLRLAQCRKDLRIRTNAILVLVMVLLLAPLVWIAMQDLQGQWGASRDSAFGISAFGFTYLSVLTGYSLGPALRELHSMSLMEALREFSPWLLILAFPVVVLAQSGWRQMRGSRTPAALLLLMTLPVIVVGGLSAVGPWGYNIRHVVWIAVPILAWLAIGMTVWPARRVIAGTIVLTICWGAALVDRHYVDRYKNEDAQAVGSFLSANAKPQDPIFVVSGYMSAPVRHYLGDPWFVVGLPDVGRDAEGLDSAMSIIKRETPGNSSYWLLRSRAFHGDPGGVLLAELQKTADLQEVAKFAGFDVYKAQK